MIARETIPPSRFVAALLSGDIEAMEEKRVQGFVSLRGETITVPVRALYTHFEGDVDLSDCTFESGVDFSGCTFARTLSLRNVSVDGDLVLDDVQVHNLPSAWRTHLPGTFALDLRGIDITGDLHLMRSLIAGQVQASEADIDGSVQVHGIEVDSGVDFSNAQIGANFDFRVWVSSPGPKSAWRPCVVRGGLRAPNMSVRGLVAFMGVQVEGGVELWGGTFRSSVFLYPYLRPDEEGLLKVHTPTTIVGSLNFAACTIDGHIQIESAVVTGKASFFSMTCASARIGTYIGTYTKAQSLDPGPTRVGFLDAFGAETRGDFTLNRLLVTGTHEERGLRGAQLQNLSVKGNFSCWSLRGVAASDPIEVGATINGDFDLRNASIEGECRLTNLSVTGTVRLNDARVRGDIAFRSVPTLLADANCDRTMRERLLEGGKPVRAMVHALDLSMVRCDNDVDLTGLDLVRNASARQTEGAPGSVKATNLEAAGTVELYAEDKASGATAWANIPGAADFSNAKVGRFVLSAHGFQAEQAREQEIETNGLRLAGAEIGELKIVAVRREAESARRHGRWRRRTREMFPTPVDLRDMSVRVWSIGLERRPSVEKFKSLMLCDPVFRRDTYVRVEAWLRNGGHVDDATAIYKAMKAEEQQQKWRDATWRQWPALALGHGLIHWPYRWFLGYGTAPARLLLVIAVLWIVSLPAYYEPTNLEASLAYRQANDLDPALATTISPEPDFWYGSTPFFASIQNHLPVIGVAVREEWELKDTGDLCWNWRRLLALPGTSQLDGGCDGVRVAISPEDAGLLISLLNWALWPLVLSFMIRKLLR